MKNIKKTIPILIFVTLMVVLSMLGYGIYRIYEMNKLINITNHFFEEYAKKSEKKYENQNMKAKFVNNETSIISGNKNEFIGMVFYEINIDVNGEKDYVSDYIKMRIKKDKSKGYKLIEEGKNLNSNGLQMVNYSNKNNTRNLKKIKKKIDENETKKTLGINYKVISNKLKFSYNNQKSWVDVPIPKDYLVSNIDYSNKKLNENNCYISHKKTSFASSFNSDILITTTNNHGEDWTKFTLKNAYKDGEIYLGFTNQENGYCVVTTDVAMGSQYNYIYVTTDGGKTFKEIGNTNEVYSRVVTGAGFLDENIGFIGFRYENDNNPTVYRTDDAGKTWSKLEIKLPPDYSYDYATPLNPKFKDDIIMLPVQLRDNNTIINFISIDKGLTFEYVRE